MTLCSKAVQFITLARCVSGKCLTGSNSNMSHFLHNPCVLMQFSRSIKKLTRYPIRYIRHDPENVGKTVDEYAEDAKHKTANLDLDFYTSRRKLGPLTEAFEIQSTEATDLEIEASNLTSNNKFGKLDKVSTEAADFKMEALNINSYNQFGKLKTHHTLKFLNFLIYNNANKKIKRFLEYGKSAKLRYTNDIFLVEGWRLLAEALLAGIKPETIFYSRSRLLAQMASILSMKERELAEFLNLFPLIKTPYQTLQTWSVLSNSPGVTAAFKISDVVTLTKSKPTSGLPVIVILDGIRDPSNLGSIIRSLVAAGIQKLILMKGCCDLWDTKVLRAACGGHFRIHIESRIQWNEVMTVLPNYPCIYLADARVNELDYEANNIDEIDSKTETKMTDILQLRNLSVTESHQQTFYQVDEDNNKIILNESFKDKEHLSIFSKTQLPISNYQDVGYFKPFDGNPLVLLIGGETGLSNEAKKFAIENDGTQISIPMNNGVDSLNSAVTSSILVYEMLRQYESWQRTKSDSVNHLKKN